MATQITISDQFATVPEAAEILDVSEESIRRYCRDGLLPWERIGGRQKLIPRGSLANFSLPARGNPTFLTIARRRERAALEAAEREKLRSSPAPVSLVDAAMTAAEKSKADEAEQQRRQRDERLQSYRDILNRRHKPADGDAEQLADVATHLGFDRRRIERDVATLNATAEWETKAASVQEAEKELATAKAELDRLEKLVAELKQKRIEYNRAQRHFRECARASAEIRSIRDANPDLFLPPTAGSDF